MTLTYIETYRGYDIVFNPAFPRGWEYGIDGLGHWAFESVESVIEYIDNFFGITR